MATAADNRRGIIAMLAAVAWFVTSDTLLKLAGGSYPTSQIIAVRGGFAVLTALTMTIALGGRKHLRAMFRPLVGLRALLETCTTFSFIAALVHMPLANITAILQGTPLLMTVIAAATGMETIRWRRWLAIVVGFTGVLIVIRPTGAGFDHWSALALLSACCAASRDLVTRRIGPDIPSVVVMFATTLALALAGLLVGASDSFATWTPLHLRDILLMAGSAVVVSMGNVCIVMAYRNTDISLVASFRYSVILWAIALGYFIWGDLPDMPAIAGTMLIIASGLYTIHRERVRAREAVAPVQRAVSPAVERSPS